MHQAKKGNQWHFGMKAHIGVDKDSGLVHTLTTTAANASDISQTAALLHGQEQGVWADAGYVGVDKREDMQEALAANEQTVQWHVAKRRKTIEKLADGWQKSMAQAYEKLKAQVSSSIRPDFARATRPTITAMPSPASAPHHPARPSGSLLALLIRHCDSSVPHLYPYPDLSYLPDADKGIFINSEITAAGQAMLRQSRDLAIRLEIHGRSCSASAEPMTPQLLQKLLADALFRSDDARRRLAQTSSQISHLSDVATLAFNDFLVAAPYAVLRTPLDAATLRALSIAGVDMTGCFDPGKLYQALCVRLMALERLAMRLALESLKLDLQVQRLRLLSVAGNFLSAQALRILNKEFGESDELPGMHLSEIRLNACTTNPYDAEWPTPALGRQESKFLHRRAGARVG